MSSNRIPPVDRTCGTYAPGHQPHFIQVKKSWTEGPQITLSQVTVHDDGLVDLEGADGGLTVWNHHPERLRAVLEHQDQRAVWKPRFGVLSVPGPFGYVFSMAPLDKRTPCHRRARQVPGESTSDFIERAIREDHGFMVPSRFW
jgi:hypothetical protein